MTTEPSICGVVEGFYGRPWTTEQRHDLFNRLHESGLNAYLYAPKDDEKHRAKWRELYTDDEKDLLKSLIDAATKSNVLFIYALSPGVDIVYSDPVEVQMVIEKLRQVQSMGCRSFALLYDDILQEMRPEDRSVFESFADAQVSITNQCYAELGKPLFSFCPTEYRGNNFMNSPYLKTVGQKLDPKIMVMWTGPAVVSRQITEEHLKEVSYVLQRKPLIWDNLHANDYDPKRVFMGPFSGRRINIKKLISGVLLNPNCQYEANYLPIYTLGEWFHADEDYDQEVMNKSLLHPTVKYEPDQSLARGISKWILLFNGGIGPCIPPISSVESQVTTPVIDYNMVSNTMPPMSIRTCEANELIPAVATELPAPLYTSPIGTATTVTVQAFPIGESIMNISDANNVAQIVNSLSAEYSEPMDTNSVKESEEEEMVLPQMSPMDTTCTASPNASVTPVDYESLREPIATFTPALINIFDGKKSIKLLVDFFYLPFNSGANGYKMLKDFQWLHEHANIMVKAASPLEDDQLNVVQWVSKAEWIGGIVDTITNFHVNLLDAPNRNLAQEIFPFVWEMQSILTILKALIDWMQLGLLTRIPHEQGDWWDTSHLQEEPWSLGGGLLVDLQKLIVKNHDIAEFFSLKLATPPSASCYTLGLANVSNVNRQELFEFFTDRGEKNIFITDKAFYDQFFVMFDSYFTPAHHFMGKEIIPGIESKVVGYFFAIADLPKIIQMDGDFSRRLNDALPSSLDGPSHFILPFKELPEDFLEKFPSYVDLRWRDDNQDAPVCVRRVLQCGVAALSMNGSTGCFSLIPSVLVDRVDMYVRLGFQRSTLNIQNFTLLVHRL